MNLINMRKNRKNLDDSMIPAINIVFLLLIFFMIAGRIENRDTKLQVPKSTSQMEFKKEEIEIKIMPDGKYLINNNEIKNSLIKELESLSINKETIITCHIHNDLSISKLDPILEAIESFGIKQFNIATQRQ